MSKKELLPIDEWAFRGSHAFYDSRLRVLASELPQNEKWSADGKSDFGILRSYIAYTFEKLKDEQTADLANKQEYIYEDDVQACFNTGLYDRNLQQLYFHCRLNPNRGRQKWMFSAFYNEYTIKFTDVPAGVVSKLRRPNYFSDPSALIYDVRLKIVPQWDHILDNPVNFQRIPEQIRALGREQCRNNIEGSINSVEKRIKANYKTVVPQWYRGKIQLLVPLYLTNSLNPDLALVLSLSEDKSQYFGHTCLTMEMAYNNARLIARPDSDWLAP